MSRRILSIAAVLATPIALGAQINLWTNRYDQDRTGANLAETTLTVANVSASRFGQIYSYPVDGPVYAQPLYLSGVTVNGAHRNVLFVATMNDKVYAFDADSSSPTPLWLANFTNPPSVTAIPITHILAVNGGNIIGNVGIQGTPVIDQATQTMYLVARTEESGSFVQRLHALDVTTGRERSGSPVVIAGSVPGNGADSTIVNGTRVVTFDPKMHMQRAGLALANGVVLVAWATHEDITPSRGWIMGFDATTLARVGIFATEPDSYLGGIWQGGRAPPVDAAGNAYFATGNGQWDGVANFGDSLLKFSVARGGLTLVDYFTPGNETDLRANDKDLSGSGFTRLPGTNLLLGGGKEGVLYLLDGNNLGHKVANDTQIPQKIPVNGGHVMGGPVYWNSATAGPLVYNWSETDVLIAYRFANGRLSTTPYAQGGVLSPGHPGGSLTVSANGSAANTGIVWASMPTNQDAKHNLAAGILRAFNAETLAELWNSDQSPTRDRVGNLMKFVPPVVANGKVFLPNHDNAVRVYGLLSVAPPSGGPGVAAAGDAYVQGGASAAVNFGSAVELLSKRGSSDDFTRITYVKFDIGSIGTIGKAVLRLTGHLSSISDANVRVTLSAIADTSWAENSLTWNARPALGASLGVLSVTGTSPQTFDVDVTSWLQAEQRAGHRFVSFAASNPDATKAYVTFSSRESGANGPRLLTTTPSSSTAEDAYVQAGAAASTNFGSAPELRIKFGSSPDTTRQAYLKFDAGSASATLARATLRVFGALSSTKSSNVQATLFGIDDTSWSESTITWNTKPAAGAVLGGITVPDTTPRWFEIDVTSYVRGQIAAGRRVVGFRFAAPAMTSAYISLNSREAATNQPQLVIDGAGGAADAYVRGGTSADTNFGSAAELLVKQGASADTTRETYLKFDIPSGHVPSAVLRLYGQLSTNDSPQVTTNAYGVANTSWQSSTLTWNNRPTGGTEIGTITVVGTTPGWVQLDVTNYVNAEISAGRTAMTIAIRSLAYTNSWVSFNSSEAAANRPELVVN